MVYIKSTFFLAILCLTLTACGESAHPAPEQKATMSTAAPPPAVPVAATANGSETNTGNRANGEQPATGKK